MINLWPQSQNYFAISPFSLPDSVVCSLPTLSRELSSPHPSSRDPEPPQGTTMLHKLHPKAKRKPIARCTLWCTSLWFIFGKERKMQTKKICYEVNFFLAVVSHRDPDPGDRQQWLRTAIAKLWQRQLTGQKVREGRSETKSDLLLYFMNCVVLPLMPLLLLSFPDRISFVFALET